MSRAPKLKTFTGGRLTNQRGNSLVNTLFAPEISTRIVRKSASVPSVTMIAGTRP